MKELLIGLLVLVSLVWSGCTQPASPAATQPAVTTAPTTQVATTAPTTKPVLTDPRAKAQRVFELNQISGQAYTAKQYSRALEALAELVLLTPDSGPSWYNLACIQCLMGKTDEALASLEKSIKLGYSEIRHMERDPDLTALRKHPRFVYILEHRDQIQRDRADKVLAALRARMGTTYAYDVDHAHRLIYASGVDAQDLAEIKSHLTAYQAAEAKTIFSHSPDQYIAVVIPKEFNRQPGRPGGYYNPSNKMLVVGSIGMVLTHEFTHALHGADQEALGQSHAIWTIEGLATLYESSEIRDGRVVPLPNGRLNVMQQLIRANQAMPLEQFVKVDPMTYSMRSPKVCYSEGQCLMRYLYAKGLLKKWYDTYVATFEQDKTGALSLEKVTGKKLPELDKDLKAWVLAQKPVPVGVQVNGAYIGVQVQPVIDGLKIVRTVPGAGADKAGLKAGDVIIRLDGKRLLDPESLTELVTARKVGQKLPIEFRRDGKTIKTEVLLMAKPAETTQPASQPATKP